MSDRDRLERAAAREIWRTYLVKQDRKEVSRLCKGVHYSLSPKQVLEYVKQMERNELE